MTRDPRETPPAAASWTLSAGCNWDAALIDALRGTRVDELYGKLAADPFGGGRPRVVSPDPGGRREAERYVRRARAAGFRFNYLLNGICQGNLEYSRLWQRRARRFLDWLSEIAVDSVTVATPLVARMITRDYPQLRVKVGIFAHVDSLERVRRWEDLGADVITLYPMAANRDFDFLERAASQASCALQVVANNACLMGCIAAPYHACCNSHSSQVFDISGGFSLEYCVLSCKLDKLRDLGNLLRCDFVRPEDLPQYTEVGIRRFKLVDRTHPTTFIANVARAYTAGRYDGNLMDLFPHMNDSFTRHFEGFGPLRKVHHLARHYFRPTVVDVRKVRRYAKQLEGLGIELDNRALDGYLDGLRSRGCTGANCTSCGFCSELAERCVRVDPAERERRLRGLQGVLDEIESGGFFSYGGSG